MVAQGRRWLLRSWVGVAEVAAHLQVAKDSIYRWVDSKGLPAHRVGRLLCFRLSEVDEWIKTTVGVIRRFAHRAR